MYVNKCGNQYNGVAFTIYLLKKKFNCRKVFNEKKLIFCWMAILNLGQQLFPHRFHICKFKIQLISPFKTYYIYWIIMRYRTCCCATRWCAARTTSLPKTVCRRSSTRTRMQSCATPTMPNDRENTGSWMPSSAATTSIHMDCSRNTSSSRTLWTNIVPSGRPTIVRCRAICRPFTDNTASHSWYFAPATFRCKDLLACSRPIWWRTIVACLTGSLLWIKKCAFVFVTSTALL